MSQQRSDHSLWIPAADLFDNPLFAGQRFGRIDACVWLLNVWQSEPLERIASLWLWKPSEVADFLSDLFDAGLIQVPKFSSLRGEVLEGSFHE